MTSSSRGLGLIVFYNEASHALQAYVNVQGENVKLTRQSSETYWLNQHPEYCKAVSLGCDTLGIMGREVLMCSKPQRLVFVGSS